MSATTKTEDKSNMPVFNTARAMSLLWQKSASELKAHELEWLAKGAVQQISDTTHSLSDVLMDIGCLVLSDDGATGSFQEASSVSNLMFSLSHQLSTLNGLASIAIDAAYMARLARGEQP